MVKLILAVLFIVAIFSSSCVMDQYDSRLNIVNNSKIDLFIYREFSIKADTIVHCKGCFTQKERWDQLLPNDTIELGLHGDLYDKHLQQYPNEILRVFVFASDTIKKYGWERAKNEYRILKRYDITLKYIIENNWVITYQ